jgi:hypothetical protein
MEQGLIIDQFDELRALYTGLTLQKTDGVWNILGQLAFIAKFSEQIIEDEYSIHVVVPESYPDCVPVAYETGNRIPRYFHKYKDENLCLGEPFAVWKTFSEQPTLLGFIQKCLIPYLYSYSYLRQFGKLPFGDLPHGAPGQIKYYKDLFNVGSEHSLFGLISILAQGEYRGHVQCPCGSKKRLRLCHGPQILEIMRSAPPGYFKSLYLFMSQRGLACLR